MPLLLDAILSKLDPTINEADHMIFKIAFTTMNEVPIS